MKNLYKKLFLFFCATCFTWLSASAQLTPIARVDVVPHQRISQGETFNFGVVAFSKAGINRVVFTISGQGYSGGTQTVYSMTNNPRTDVFEYWIPISASSFSSSGQFTVSVVVHGNDGGTRNLGATAMMVTPDNNLAQPKAWISNTGSDATGELGDQSKPYQTVGGAIGDIQSTYGSSNGAILYFMSGTYSISYGTAPSVSNEWLTVTKAAGASVTITNVGTSLDAYYVRFKDVTIQRTGTSYVVPNGIINYAWFDGCTIVGRGRNFDDSNAIQNRSSRGYWTGNDISNLSLAIMAGILSRSNFIHHISDDAHQNTLCVINDRVDDQDPAAQYPNNSPHADVYQMHVTKVPSPDNIIVYGVYATNIHYQGIFCRPSSEGIPPKSASNVAFVNNFIELRDPIRQGPDGNWGGPSCEMQGIFNHLLVWQNTFAKTKFRVNYDTRDDMNDVFSFTNVSIVGNYFYLFQDEPSNGTAFDAGNSNNNETVHNHFRYSLADGYDPGDPQGNSYSPDTEDPPTDTKGTVEIDLTDPTTYVNFGYPSSGSSVLINRLTSPVVPADIFGNLRGASPDVGAIEYGGGSSVSVTGVTVSPDVLGLNIGQTADLTETVSPSNATNKSVSWSTSNASIATVNATGLVTAIGAGNATITVTTVDGSFTDNCAVTVSSTSALINEDFSAGASNFTVVSGGTWTVTGGQYVLTNPATAGVGLLGNISVHNTPVIGDFELNTLVNITDTSSVWRDAAVIFNYQDADNYYYVSLNENNDGTTKGLFKIVNGVYTQIADITATVVPGTNYNLGIAITGSTIVVTLNGAQVATATDAGVTGGKVGYGSKNDGATFDNLLVYGTSSVIAVTGVSVSPAALALTVGGSSDLTATVSPSDATDPSVAWSTSNPSVATVNSVTGHVTAVGAGNATITATTNDGGFTDNCLVTVSPAPLIDEDFSVGASNFTTSGGTWNVAGGRYVLTPDPISGGLGLLGNFSVHNTTVSGDFELSTVMNITGTSSTYNDAAIVFNYVDANNYYYVSFNESNDGGTSGIFKVVGGVFTQLEDITTSITTDIDHTVEVSLTDGDIVVLLDGTQVATEPDAGATGGKVGYGSKNDAASFDNLLVFGSSTIAVTGVSISPATLALTVGGSSDLTATVSPSNATDPSVTWSTSNASVATVNSAGHVTAVGSGNATITATTNDGSFTDVCQVTVTVPVTGVSVSPTTLDLTVGQTSDLTETVSPSNASDPSVIWSTNNASVATVNANGLVTAVGAGNAVITVTTIDGGYTDICSVTVTVPVTGVSVSPDVLSLTVGQTSDLTETVSPANASNKNVSWSTSNGSVATVNTNGLVTAVGLGNAVITVTTIDGSFTDTCSVSVIPTITDVTLVCSFIGTSPGLNTPWTNTSTLEGNIDYSGWSLGAGTNGYSTNNVLGFTINGPVGARSTLNEAINDNEYVYFTIEPIGGSTLNLNGISVNFSIQRLNSMWSAMKYAVFTSVAGFTSGNEVYVTDDITSAYDYAVHSYSFNLPSTGYDNLSGEVEFRIYAYESQYGSKPTSIAAFSLSATTIKSARIVVKNESLKSLQEITVFPNPLRAGSPLNIDLNQHEDILGIHICDTNGRILYSKTNIVKNVIKIPNNFKTGLYVVKVQTLHTTKDFKFIVTQ